MASFTYDDFKDISLDVRTFRRHANATNGRAWPFYAQNFATGAANVNYDYISGRWKSCYKDYTGMYRNANNALTNMTKDKKTHPDRMETKKACGCPGTALLMHKEKFR